MERIGELRIEELLLEGIRGRIWLAVDEGSGERLTVHVATPDAPGPAFAAPGAGEHLAPVRAEGALGDGIPWYATAWFEASLEELLDAAGGAAVDTDRALGLPEELLTALAAAADNGQTHLGLDARLVRLDAAGAVRLLGFGVGPSVDALADGANDASLVRACRAPELDVPGTPVDGRADLYAVAVLAHRLLTGALPQQSAPDPDLMVDRILSGRTIAAPWVPPSRLNAALPLPVADWLLKGLAQDPAERFTDARAMRKALRASARPEPQARATEAPAAPPPAPETLPETIEALIDAARVGARERQTLRDLAAAVQTDGERSGADPTARTRAALREAARAAGMDVEHLDALLLGRYRPRRAPGAARRRPKPPPPPEEAPVTEPEPIPEAQGTTADEAQADGGGNGVLMKLAIAMLLGLGALLVLSDPSPQDPTPSVADAAEMPAAPRATPGERGDAGDRFRDGLASGGEGPELVVVPAGRFRMGCVSRLRCASDELPVHEVELERPFAVGVYEVTFEDYDRFAAATGHPRPGDERWGRGRHPAINVSWNEAQAYLAWLSEETGERYRLPTEAEWEYFARAGSEAPWFFGSETEALCAHGNVADALTNYDRRNDACTDGVGRRTAEVGSYAANAFGLHDTLGNLWEWVEDCYVGSYEGASGDGSARTVDGTCPTRTLRGGGLNSGPDDLRSANRERNSPTLSLYYIGFRVVREL